MASLSLFQNLRLLWLAFFDERTPMGAKIVVIVALLYGISPIDLIPDFIPIFGQLDDFGVLVLALLFFIKATHAVRQKLQAIDVTPKK